MRRSLTTEVSDEVEPAEVVFRDFSSGRFTMVGRSLLLSSFLCDEMKQSTSFLKMENGLDLSDLFLKRTFSGISSKVVIGARQLLGTGHFSVSVAKSEVSTYFLLCKKKPLFI